MKDKAVIWDLDGVIVDTAGAHFTAWQELCRRHGRGLDERQFRATFGQRNEEIIAHLFREDGIGGQGRVAVDAMRALAEEKEDLFRALAASHVRLLPGVVRLLSALREADYAQGIGSSAPLANVELLTSAVGVRGYFSTIVSGEDVAAGKPDPEIFLLAAGRLGVPPAHCVVIEDAATGVAAAKSAGMACVAVTNTRERQALASADLIVDTLEELDAAMIARVVGRRPEGG